MKLIWTITLINISLLALNITHSVISASMAREGFSIQYVMNGKFIEMFALHEDAIRRQESLIKALDNKCAGQPI